MVGGNIVLNMGLNRTNFNAGVKSVRGRLGSLVGYAKKTGNRIASGIGAGFNSAKLLYGAAGMAAGFALVTVNVNRTANEIGNLAKTADRLGISTKHLAGLRHAAKGFGMEAEDADEFLKNMNEKIGLARFGDQGALEQFQKLNISLEELEGLSTMDAFNLMADKVKAIDDPTQRLAASLELFGEEGNKMMAVLSQGSGGVAKMVAEADKLGLAVNRVDAAKVEMANGAYKKMEAGLQGLWNMITVAVAPVLEYVATLFFQWMNSGGSASDMITSGLRMVVQGVGIVGDVVNGLIGVFNMMQAGVSKVLAYIFSAINKLAEGLSYLGGLVGMDFDTSFLKSMADEMHRMADQDAVAAANKINKAFDGSFGSGMLSKFDAIQAKANQTATKIADDANKKINSTKSPGTGINLEKSNQLKEAAKSIFDATRTPLENFKTEAAELQMLFSKGLINEDTFNRGIAAAKKKAVGDKEESDDGKAKVLDNKAITRGSAEAVQVALRASLGLNKNSAEAKKIAEAKKQSTLLAGVKDTLEQMRNSGTPIQIASI